jgi:iron-sulfur cluster assembly protein
MITLTEQAKNKIKDSLKKRGKGVGIRIGVRTTGCSGLSYVLEYVDSYEYQAGVINYAHDDVVVLIDRIHEPYLDGMSVDFTREGLNEGFKFINPNSRGECGCGESFRV